LVRSPWPPIACKCCGQELAAPGWYQCPFCIHVDPTADRRARVDEDLAALADVERRAVFRVRMSRATADGRVVAD